MTGCRWKEYEERDAQIWGDVPPRDGIDQYAQESDPFYQQDDPESPVADPHADDRPSWTPVYMGEGLARRCQHCGQTYWKHDDDYHCLETFLRQQDGDR